MKRILSYFTPKTPWTFVYMLQQVEYNPSKFINWIFSLPNLGLVQKRGALKTTNRVKLMLIIGYGVWLACILYSLLLALKGSIGAIVVILIVPDATILSLYLSTAVLQSLVINPSQNRELSSAKSKMEQSKATRIAVLGSYGKTTMKELLVTVLSEGKKIKATPGNKNVVISHARWVNTKIDGDEDVLVFEYGEAEPGDISKFASLSSPEIAVITGIAPAHMDGYPNLESITRDFAAIADTVKDENIFVKKAELLESIKGNVYGVTGIGDWRVSDIKIDFAGTNFTLRNSVDSLQLHSGLLGVHQVGPISAAAVIAKKLGLTNKQIIDGMAKTQPYEHRMQPRQLHGAWILDDTYNGNIEGMKAGLELLSSLPGKRKVYVTPGLVDQGIETENIHKQLGRLIAHANPDKVVLMQNSVTSFIQVGLSIEKFTGEVTIENDPLEYYTNLEHFLAGGDVVMLQNDWPDSYI